MDFSNIGQMSDEDLLSMQRSNLPSNAAREAAKAELEYRNSRRMAASAASTEKSGKRMEFATWVILFATIAQLILIVGPMLRGHDKEVHEAATVRVEPPKQVTAGVVADWKDAEETVSCDSTKMLPFTALDGRLNRLRSVA